MILPLCTLARGGRSPIFSLLLARMITIASKRKGILVLIWRNTASRGKERARSLPSPPDGSVSSLLLSVLRKGGSFFSFSLPSAWEGGSPFSCGRGGRMVVRRRIGQRGRGGRRREGRQEKGEAGRVRPSGATSAIKGGRKKGPHGTVGERGKRPTGPRLLSFQKVRKKKEE